MNHVATILIAMFFVSVIIGCGASSPLEGIPTRAVFFGGYTIQVPMFLPEDTTVYFFHGGIKFSNGLSEVDIANGDGWVSEESFYDEFGTSGKIFNHHIETVNGMKCFIVTQSDSTGCYVAVWPYGHISMVGRSSNPYDLDWLLAALKTIKKQD